MLYLHVLCLPSGRYLILYLIAYDDEKSNLKHDDRIGITEQLQQCS
jgi:hypothetical protein